jgi:hypothetical protein
MAGRLSSGALIHPVMAGKKSRFILEATYLPADAISARFGRRRRRLQA